jgi:hypothetical protein
MQTLPYANTFFLISSIGFVILGGLLAIVLGYLIRVLSNLRHITDKARLLSDRAKLEGDYFLTELHDMSERMRSRSFNVLSLVWFIRKLIRRYT